MDLKERTVDSIFFLAAAVIGLFLSGRPVLCGVTIASCLFLNRIPKIPIGEGDIDAILLIITALGQDSIIALSFGCIAMIIYCAVKKIRKDAPFVFCLAIGYGMYLVMYFVSWIM